MPLLCTRGAASVLGLRAGGVALTRVIYQSPGVNSTGDASTLTVRGAAENDWLIGLTWNGFVRLDGVNINGGSEFVVFKQLAAADLSKKVSFSDGASAQPGLYYIVRGPNSVNNLVINSLASGSPTTTSGYTKNSGWAGHLMVCLLYYSNFQTSNSVTSPTQINFGYANENTIGRTITGQLMLPGAPYTNLANFTWHGDAGSSDPSDRLRGYEFRV